MDSQDDPTMPWWEILIWVLVFVVPIGIFLYFLIKYVYNDPGRSKRLPLPTKYPPISTPGYTK